MVSSNLLKLVLSFLLKYTRQNNVWGFSLSICGPYGDITVTGYKSYNRCYSSIRLVNQVWTVNIVAATIWTYCPVVGRETRRGYDKASYYNTSLCSLSMTGTSCQEIPKHKMEEEEMLVLYSATFTANHYRYLQTLIAQSGLVGPRPF